jgi:hypothetical protein
MFSDILALLEKHGRLSLRELASLLRSDPGAVEPMMNLLLKKGRVELLSFECSGGSCANCESACREDALIYRLPEN